VSLLRLVIRPSDDALYLLYIFFTAVKFPFSGTCFVSWMFIPVAGAWHVRNAFPNCDWLEREKIYMRKCVSDLFNCVVLRLNWSYSPHRLIISALTLTTVKWPSSLLWYYHLSIVVEKRCLKFSAASLL
jgi:hypothetical protein